MSLLRELQQITERTYQQNSGINLEHFIIGKERFVDLSNRCDREVHELSEIARVFFRILDTRLLLAVYFSNDLISVLEQNDPRRGLSEKNIHAFMVFIEEINHSIHGALKFASGETEIQKEEFVLDLELLAKIDTYQILKIFLAYFNPSKQLEKFDRLWLKHHVFERADFPYQSQKLQRRYEEANRLGEKYTRYLEGMPTNYRPGELRRFRSLTYPMKSGYIRMLPA